MAPTIEHNEFEDCEPVPADEPSQGVERAVPQPDADGRLIVTADDGDRQVDVTGMGPEEARIVRKYGLVKRVDEDNHTVTYLDDFYRLVCHMDGWPGFPLSVKDGSSGSGSSSSITYSVGGPITRLRVNFELVRNVYRPSIDYVDPAWRNEVRRTLAVYEQVRRSADWMQELVDAEVV